MSAFTMDKLRATMRQMEQLAPLGPPIRLVASDLMLIGPFEDWSKVRSPSRAARRRKLGHPQRIRLYYKPDPKLYQLPDGTTVGHPSTVDQVRRAIEDRPCPTPANPRPIAERWIPPFPLSARIGLVIVG